jgi:uncharacterized membrane protein YhaH (DUF805 family)
MRLIDIYIWAIYSIYARYEGDGRSGAWFAICMTVGSNIIAATALVSYGAGVSLLSGRLIVVSFILSAVLAFLAVRRLNVRRQNEADRAARIWAMAYSIASIAVGGVSMVIAKSAGL